MASNVIAGEAASLAGENALLEVGGSPEDLPAARPSKRAFWIHFDRAVGNLTAALLVAVVVTAVLQVFMRYVMHAPLAWPEELARWMFLWLVMLGCVTVTRTGSHIRMPLFVHRLPEATRPYTDLLGILLSATALALIGWLGLRLMLITTATSIVGGVSYLWLYLALPTGSLLSLVTLTRAEVAGKAWWAVTATVAVGAGLAFAMLELIQYSYLIVLDPTGLSLLGAMLFLALGAPVAHALLLGAAVAFFAGGLPEVVLANYFASQISTNFTLLAIPFFILMGALMNVGGITAAIVALTLSLVGHLRGGLGQVNVMTSTLLGGLSGSSSADSAMVAKLLGPHMEKSGYPRAFAGALTAVGSITTTLIPPSISFLIYASLAGVSVGAIFAAGIIPGLIFAAALMVAVWLLTGTIYPTVKREPRAAWKDRGRALLVALPSLALPLGILMMLRGGVVTATEAGAIACVFALVIGPLFYRQGSPKAWWEAARASSNDTAVIMFLLAASAPLAWIMIAEQVPVRIAESLAGIDNPMLLMLGIVVFLLIVGLILEPPPAQVLVVPILAPIAQAAGIDLVWLGVVLVLTVMLGQITPPVGGLVFIVGGVLRAKVTDVYWEARWLYLPVFVVILLLVLFPQLSLWLPGVLGFGR